MSDTARRERQRIDFEAGLTDHLAEVYPCSRLPINDADAMAMHDEAANRGLVRLYSRPFGDGFTDTWRLTPEGLAAIARSLR